MNLYSRDAYGRGSSRRQGGKRSARGGYENGYPGSGTRRTRSVRVGDVRRASRNSAIKDMLGNVAVKLLPLLAIVVVAVAIYVVLSLSGVFRVNKVTVEGTSYLSSDQILELADVPEGVTLINVDSDAIRNRVLSNGWVKDVSVDKTLPDTLTIRVTEQNIDAVVQVTSMDAKSTENWAISADGTWLIKIPDRDSDEGKKFSDQTYEKVDSVLHITDVPYGVQPVAGAACTDDSVLNALAIITGMTTELRDQVKTVSATGTETTTLTLYNGVQIAFGAAENIRDKERVCLSLMDEYEGTIAYINVRNVNRPTWRSV